MKPRLVLLMLAACLLVGGPARAQDDTLNRARESFDKAQTLFEAGNYADAAAGFEAAYAARPFAQFLFNIGACHEKLGDFEKAIEYYKRYVHEAPTAPDRKKTDKRIEALEKAIAELAAAAEAAAAAPPVDPDNPDATPPPPVEKPAVLASLEPTKLKGLVVVESDPAGANIYIDSKKGKPLSKTPWNGELSGDHTIFLEREGYKPVERRISPANEKFLMVVFVLAEEDYLGWVDITSNIAGADIYIDDKAVGVYNKTPFQGNLPPGKHKIWVTKEGYDEHYEELNVVAGKTHKIDATLKGTPVGYLSVRGRDVDKTRTYMDGKLLCERACIKPVPEGTHTLTVKRDGYKPYTVEVNVQAKSETTLRAQLAEKPSRMDAVVAYFFAGAFIGAGVWAGTQAGNLHDELQADIDSGAPPPPSDDPRFLRGKLFAIGADAAYTLGGLSLLGAIYYTFRDKGAPSTGTTDQRALAVEPQLTPTYAGVGMEVRW